MSEPLQYACDEHSWCDYTPCPKCASRTLDDRLRQSFERWILAKNYGYEVLRYPDEKMKYAWPGQYRSQVVQLAWEAWHEAAGVKERDSYD